MTMHEERLEASVLDMFYGTRDEWFSNEIPYGMNVQLSNPAYIDHCYRTEEVYDYSVGLRLLQEHQVWMTENGFVTAAPREEK
jgi:hypothetical protein